MTGMTMPYTTPYSLMACAVVCPAARRRMGKSTEMNEPISDEEARMAVTGSEARSSGINSPRGAQNFPPRIRKQTRAMANEHT